jgi:hypothetical protein
MWIIGIFVLIDIGDIHYDVQHNFLIKNNTVGETTLLILILSTVVIVTLSFLIGRIFRWFLALPHGRDRKRSPQSPIEQ